jgi:imidazolonepropionase-like amidohydrolase
MILFTNARIFDGSGEAPFTGDVLVEGDVIKAVEHGAGRLTPGDARVIDAKGATLMPGLIDAHAHLAMGSSVEKITPPGHRTAEETAEIIAHTGRVILDHGFTGAYSGGATTPEAEVAMVAAFASGAKPGPRLRSASFERLASGEINLKSKFTSRDDRPSDTAGVIAFVEEMADLGVDTVKFLLGGVSAFDAGANLVPQFHEDELAAANKAAQAKGVWLTAHAYTPDAIGLAVRNGFRMLYHCTWADEQSLDLIEAHKDQIYIAPGPGIAEADQIVAPRFGVMASPAQIDEQAETVDRLKKVGAELRRRGVRSLPGGDYGFPWNPIGLNARDLELFVDWFGYSPTEAILAATRTAGELMATERPLGVITPGAHADLILVAGKPDEDIALLVNSANLLTIVAAGRLHKAPA